MDAQDIRHILAELHRIANATERIYAALEAANQADPLQMIERAMRAESGPTAPQMTQDARDVVGNGPDLAGQEWRFR